jgi:hypothetical protein
LRASGVYPKEGEETEADILNLKKSGETVLAVRCYRTLHGASLKEAHAAVLGQGTTPRIEIGWSVVIVCVVVIAIAIGSTMI